MINIDTCRTMEVNGLSYVETSNTPNTKPFYTNNNSKYPSNNGVGAPAARPSYRPYGSLNETTVHWELQPAIVDLLTYTHGDIDNVRRLPFSSDLAQIIHAEQKAYAILIQVCLRSLFLRQLLCCMLFSG